MINSASGDQIDNTFREDMLKNPTLHGMTKLTFSWDKTTDNFAALGDILS